MYEISTITSISHVGERRSSVYVYVYMVWFIAIAATHPGQAADAGEREKDLKHDDDVSQARSQFFPLAVETLGL